MYNPKAAGRAPELAPGDMWETGGLSPQAGDESGRSILLGYATALWKRRVLILAILVSALLLALVLTLLTEKTYVARATFEVQSEAPQVLEVGAGETEQLGGDEAFLETQFALIQSRSIAEGVVDRLNLDQSEAFLGTPLITDTDNSPAARQQRRNAAIAQVMSQISAGALGQSTIIELQAQSNDPQLAAALANAAVDEFIEGTLERQFTASNYARNFIGTRLNELKERLAASERELVRYADMEGIISISDAKAGGQSLDSAALAALNDAMAEARANRVMAEANLRTAMGPGGGNLAQIGNNAELTALNAQLATFQAEYEQKLQTYKPTFPDMVQLAAKIDLVRSQIGAVRSRLLGSIRANYDVAVQQERQLLGEMDKLKNSVIGFQNRSIQYTILQREVDTNRALYDALLQRYKEIGVSGGSGSNRVSVVDRARAPGAPSSPNLALNLFLALIAGLGLGVGLALLLEFLDDTFKQPEDVEAKLHLPLLGLTPKVADELSPVSELRDRKSSLSESYYSVGTSIQLSGGEAMPRALFITSSEMSEGKSTTSIALAKAFADQGKRVLLVDADLRKPSLHRTLGQPNKTGLSNVLGTDTPLADAVVKVPELGFDLIPCGPLPPNPALLLTTRLRPRLAEMEAAYDLVVLDGPPVIGLADGPLLADAADATILVVQAHRIRRAAARRALRRLGSKTLGVVLTQFDPRQSGSAYDYLSYYYSYGGEKAATLA